MYFDKRESHVLQTRDSIFLTAFSMAGMFFLNVDHCSSVKLIPGHIERQNLQWTMAHPLNNGCPSFHSN